MFERGELIINRHEERHTLECKLQNREVIATKRKQLNSKSKQSYMQSKGLEPKKSTYYEAPKQKTPASTPRRRRTGGNNKKANSKTKNTNNTPGTTPPVRKLTRDKDGFVTPRFPVKRRSSGIATAASSPMKATKHRKLNNNNNESVSVPSNSNNNTSVPARVTKAPQTSSRKKQKTAGF